jgi:hypothetical protein
VILSRSSCFSSSVIAGAGGGGGISGFGASGGSSYASIIMCNSIGTIGSSSTGSGSTFGSSTIGSGSAGGGGVSSLSNYSAKISGKGVAGSIYSTVPPLETWKKLGPLSSEGSSFTISFFRFSNSSSSC